MSVRQVDNAVYGNDAISDRSTAPDLDVHINIKAFFVNVLVCIGDLMPNALFGEA